MAPGVGVASTGGAGGGGGVSGASAATPAAPSPAPLFTLFVRLPNSKSIAVEVKPWTTVGAVVDRALSRSEYRLLNAWQMRMELGGRPVVQEDALQDVGAGHMSTLRVTPCASAVDCPGQAVGEELRRLAAGSIPFPADGSFLHSALSGALRNQESLLEAGELQSKPLAAIKDSALLTSLKDLAAHPPGTAQAAFGRRWLQRLVPLLLHQFDLALSEVGPPEEGKTEGQPVSQPSKPALTILVTLSALLAGMVQAADVWEGSAGWAAELLRDLSDACVASSLETRWVAPEKASIASVWFCSAVKHVTGQLKGAVESFLRKVKRCAPREGSSSEEDHRSAASAVRALHCAVLSLSSLHQDLTSAFLACGQPPLYEPIVHYFVAGLCSSCGSLAVAVAALSILKPAPGSGASEQQDLSGTAKSMLAQLITTVGAFFQAREAGSEARSADGMERLVSELAALLSSPETQSTLEDASCQTRILCTDGGAHFAQHPVLGVGLPMSMRLRFLRDRADELPEDDDEMDEDEDEEEGATIYVSRDAGQLVETSFAELLGLSPRHLNRSLAVRFAGEPGQGAGVTREWLSLLIPQLFRPDLGLFRSCPGDPQALFPGPAASVQEGHLQYMAVAGRVMGLALLHGVPLGFRLTSAFYRGLAAGGENGGSKEVVVCFDDLEQVEPEAWRSCLEVLNAEDASQLFLTFTLSHDEFGMSVDVPLSATPDEPVTNANREAYVAAVARRLLWDRVADEVAAVRRGLQDVFNVPPTRLLSLEEFNQLALGSPAGISAAEWRQHTRCSGWGGWAGCQAVQEGDDEDEEEERDVTKEEPEVLRWFWLLVGAMNEGQRAALLRFWTSLPCLPFGGWAALPMRPRIVRADRATQPLPVAHTCFLELALPEYPDVLSLAAGLQEALAAAEGFGME